MAKYTTITFSWKTKGKFNLAKEEMYGKDLADEVSQDKFVEDLCEMVLENE